MKREIPEHTQVIRSGTFKTVNTKKSKKSRMLSWLDDGKGSSLGCAVGQEHPKM